MCSQRRRLRQVQERKKSYLYIHRGRRKNSTIKKRLSHIKKELAVAVQSCFCCEKIKKNPCLLKSHTNKSWKVVWIVVCALVDTEKKKKKKKKTWNCVDFHSNRANCECWVFDRSQTCFQCVQKLPHKRHHQIYIIMVNLLLSLYLSLYTYIHKFLLIFLISLPFFFSVGCSLSLSHAVDVIAVIVVSLLCMLILEDTIHLYIGYRPNYKTNGGCKINCEDERIKKLPFLWFA